MRLQRLRLQNFRQHVDNTIEFRLGLTGIIGPNGAGKSTILEAIAWAVYGAAAARGTNDTIRFSRAAPRARVVVDLTFDLENHEYRVTRTLNSAEVYVDNGPNPVATGVGGATMYLQSKLGMTRQEFFNTYFTGQKELQFLAQMGPADRGRFLAQVLGYERLRRAQDIAKGRRRELSAQIEGLKSGLPDPDVLKAERASAEQRLKDAQKNRARVEKARARIEQDVAAATPPWQAAQQARETARTLSAQLESAARDLQNATREVDRAQAELVRIDAAAQGLEVLKPRLEELVEVSAESLRLEELSRAHARRTVLQQNEDRLLAEIRKLDAALEGLKQAPMLLIKAQEELSDIKKSLPESTKMREALLKDWQQDAQANRTTLHLFEDGVRELEDQIRRLKEAGDAGSCPVCSKPLHGEFASVLEHLTEELDGRKTQVKWHAQRDKQLATRPQPLVDAELIMTQLQASLERKTEREAKCQKGIEDLWKSTEEKQLKEKQLAELRQELALVADGYDRDGHARVRARLAELQGFARQAGVYEHEIAARQSRQAEAEAARVRHAALSGQIESTQRDLKDLKFDEKAYTLRKERFDKLVLESHASAVAGAEATQTARGAEEAFESTQRATTAYTEKREILDALESELRHHAEMDTAVTQLRTELNARVRPELAEHASGFLADITDGRYSALDIDENYNVLVLEDGEEKPVISGGEEDIANLVLRIAISQMIAGRAGQRLSTLFLDEVFGSLDIDRRENVIQLLQKLHDRFEQVILITHVETVREGLDHVIRLEYDERSGASVVKEDVDSAVPHVGMMSV